MNRPRLIRGLRIAWTVGWGILCVLLIVLWVRSYWWEDVIFKDRKYEPIGVVSLRGVVAFLWVVNPSFDGDDRWGLDSEPIQAERGLSSAWGFGWSSGSRALNLSTPHWFLILLVGLFTAMPWLRLSIRFSLRTLFIATTLIAVVLGFLVYVTSS